jgi:DNA-binding protein H-NS
MAVDARPAHRADHHHRGGTLIYWALANTNEQQRVTGPFADTSIWSIPRTRERWPESIERFVSEAAATAMDLAQLSTHISALRRLLAAKIEQQGTFFKKQLAGLDEFGGARSRGRPSAARGNARRATTRRKPAPKYQSNKNPRMKWTWRGMLPVWMREEMKGTKLRKENFLIK